jgi:hypothetical protein
MMKFINYLISIALITGLLLSITALSACNTTPVTPKAKISQAMREELDKQWKERMPKVDSFKFESYEVVSGENAKLSWNVRQADNVTIVSTIGAVQPAGGSLGLVEAAGSREFIFPLTGKTTLAQYVYTLTAVNEYGKVTDNATVMVMDANQPPGIYFDVSSRQMHLGKGALLEWNVSRADDVTMDDGIAAPSACDASGQKIVNPLKTTTYTITASNKNGKSMKSLTLEVIP